MGAASSQVWDSRPQVFINYRKEELRHTFIRGLLRKLKKIEVNYFIDDDKKQKGKPITDLFKKIEESPIALAIFSKQYTKSRLCLDVLVKMKERVEAGELVVVPVFVNVTPSEVKNFIGEFGENFQKMRNIHAREKVQKWKEAVEYITHISGVVWNDRYNGHRFTRPCGFSDEVLGMHTAEEVKKELLRRDPNYGKRKYVGIEEIEEMLFVSAMMALIYAGFVSGLFFADVNLRYAVSCLVGLLVFFNMAYKRYNRARVTTPPPP